MRRNQIQHKRIRSRFPHLLRKLQAPKTIRVVVQPLPVVIVMALQKHDLLGQCLHNLLLLLKCHSQLAKQIIMIFQGSPLGQHLVLQLVDLPGVVILQLLILLSSLPQGLDVGQQLGPNGGSITCQTSHPTIGLFRRNLWIEQPPHQQLIQHPATWKISTLETPRH
jgi:hypothetical protein